MVGEDGTEGEEKEVGEGEEEIEDQSEGSPCDTMKGGDSEEKMKG